MFTRLSNFTLYSGQLPRLSVASFVDLAVGSIANNFHQVEDTGGVLEKMFSQDSSN